MAFAPNQYIDRLRQSFYNWSLLILVDSMPDIQGIEVLRADTKCRHRLQTDASTFRGGKIESAAIALVCSGDTLEVIGAALEQDFPDVDVATEFGVMLHRWLDDEIISIAPQNADL